MKFILIFGPQATGKMTIGQELARITNLKLLHNHSIIEQLIPIFSNNSSSCEKLSNHFHEEIFKEVLNSDLDGLIFTYVWLFDIQQAKDYVKKICNIFTSKWWEVYFVELKALLEERIKRNKDSHRLKHKPSKQNIKRSEKQLKEWWNHFRMNSLDWEIKEKNYIKIDNTKLTPEEVAKIIKEKFDFK